MSALKLSHLFELLDHLGLESVPVLDDALEELLHALTIRVGSHFYTEVVNVMTSIGSTLTMFRKMFSLRTSGLGQF